MGNINEIPNIIVSGVLGVAEICQGFADKVCWLPQYFDTEYHKTDFKRNEIYDVCFIGSDANCPKRVNWLARLNSRYNIKIAGKVAGINTRHAYGPKMSEIYLQSKIAIDIIRARALDLNFQTSDRIFKAMGNGCFYLVYPIRSLELLFRPGIHLDIYDNTFDDLCRKLDYWLDPKQEDKRKEIALAGQAEVLKNHTLKVRLKQYWKLMAEYESSNNRPKGPQPKFGIDISGSEATRAASGFYRHDRIEAKKGS
ncbi:MAG: glycosyltransferase family protein [Candidatus Thorarchaeota archaeon]|jgi:spore maturation protein CgeB